MKLSESLEQAARASIDEANNSQDAILLQDGLIAVDQTPFFASKSGDGINPHGRITHRDGTMYYIGTKDNNE